MTHFIQSIETRIERFGSWSASDHRRFLYALLLVVVNRLALWIVPYRKLQRMSDVPLRDRRENLPPERITRDVISAARFMREATCLTQALAARLLLHRAGIPAKLQLGVGWNEAGKFAAHAWVECDGRAVIGGFSAERPFVPLVESATGVAA